MSAPDALVWPPSQFTGAACQEGQLNGIAVCWRIQPLSRTVRPVRARL